MKRTEYLFAVAVLLSVLMGVVQSVNAALVVGEQAGGMTLYCLKKEDADVVAKAVSEKDEKAFEAKQAPGVCHFHPSNFTPKKVVSTFGDAEKVYVVEVESGGGTYYLITMVQVTKIKKGLAV